MKGCYIVVRGPAGSGKSTLSKKLAEHVGGHYVELDDIRTRHRLRSALKYRIRANEIAISKAKDLLDNGQVVVFDDVFYYEAQLKHLIETLRYEHYVFTIRTTIAAVLKRNAERTKVIPRQLIKTAYWLASRFDYGIVIDNTDQKEDDVLKEMLSYLPKHVVRRSRQTK